MTPLIPDWNISAVLPPIRPGATGSSPDRSPYVVQLADVVARFGTSAERLEILKGLVAYRRELTKRGVVSGFQWLNGSFMEHKEILAGSAPVDVDVVTFFHLPDGLTQTDFAPKVIDLFTPTETKRIYHVDGYPFVLGEKLERPNVKQLSYWYSMWSHRRSGIWKGFVQVDLSIVADDAAADMLATIEKERASK